MRNNHEKIKKMTFIAIFSALSLVLYIIGPKFRLPIFPSFLEINFSMLPILIATFMLGPVEGMIMVVIRFLIKLPFTHTTGVGELSDMIIGLCVAGSCGFVNKKSNSKYKLIYIYIIGIVSWILGSYISNSFSFPFYLNLYGKEAVLGACSMIPGITEDNLVFMYYIFGITPFNLCLSIVVLTVTILVHKRLRNLYDKI